MFKIISIIPIILLSFSASAENQIFDINLGALRFMYFTTGLS